MKRMIALLLAFAMLLSMAACASKGSISDAADKLNKLPVQPAKPEEPEEPEEPSEPEAPAEPEPEKNDKGDKKDENEEPEVVDPEPSQGLDAYDNPPDHPHEGMDLTVFDGLYKAKLPQDDDGETWLQITGFNDFIVLEYHGLQDGEVYRYWVEEFWPGEGWYTDVGATSVSGKSQQFNSMSQYENYSGLPQNRCITLTDDGVVLNYDDSDAEYFVRDDSFYGGHNTPEDLRMWLGEDVHLDFDYQYDAKDVVGTWGFWTGWEAACMTFAEDGTFSMFWKTPNEPIAVYKGAYGFGTNSGNLEIVAERIGYGCFPCEANWEWFVDDWGYLSLTDENSVMFEDSAYLWPVENEFFTTLTPDTALGYIVQEYFDRGEYTDQYGDVTSYYYSLPNFYYSGHKDLEKINREINEFYYPIIEMEQESMENGELLSYDYVDWHSACYNGILFLHVFAYTYDWEEHDVFYIDLDTMKELSPEEMLERMGIEEEDFVEAVRVRAEELFVNYFSDIPEEDRDTYGYYECLEQTVSDDFVNVDLPIFVNNVGQITVYVKLSSMAGSGIVWLPSDPFAPYYEYEEEAVG